MSKNIQLIAWVAFIAIAGGVVVYTLQNRNGNDGTASATDNSEAQHVEILKYSDYSCPACKAYIPIQKELERQFGDKLTIEYRHFPLGGFEHSELAARAVEAAAEQGRREEMHDKVFEEQQVWSSGNAEEIFMSYAEEFGLDQEQFERDLHSDEIRERVQRQKSEGSRRMVQGTPTFFINGQRVQQNPQNYSQFESIVEMHMYQ
ncbi:MAG: thioredoxin domain-containing protein [Balneolaceae bacterium]